MFPLADALGRMIVKKEPDIDVLICVDDKDHIPDDVLKSSPLRYADLGLADLIRDLPIANHLTVMAYARLFLPDAFRDDYDRILYMDCDILPLRYRFTEALHAKLDRSPVAAAPDLTEFVNPPDNPFDALRNTGVMLMDCRGSGAQSLFDRVLHYARTTTNPLPIADNSALNDTVASELALLSLRWNFLYVDDMLNHLDHIKPHVLHFAGPEKPWQLSENVSRRAYANAYFKLLRPYYSKREMIALGLWAEHPTGTIKYKNPLLQKVEDWNRRRRRLREAKRDLWPQTPISRDAVQSFLDAACVP